MRRRRHLAADEILADGDEVLVGAGPVFFERRLMPGWAKLSATADVGDHRNVPLLEPRRAGDGLVTGEERNLEAAVAVEKRGCRSVELQILRADLEVGHLRPIGARRLVLLDDEPLRFEERRSALELLDAGHLRLA